ncbi:hypothetical protein ACFLZB_03190 [Nanoarchaeota archaeon]
MKKTLFALLVIAMMVLVGCSAPEADDSADTTPVVDDTTTTDTEPEPTPTVAVEDLELLTDVVCVNGKINMIITNNAEEDWTINDDVKIILNGGWDEEPGCDKEVLASGESTLCEEVDFPVVLDTRKNVLVVRADGQTAKEEIYCEEAEE